jgi:carboxyl-terminal processing protease
MTLRQVIDRLRGEEGTAVEVTVRQPKAKESRTYSIVRGTLAHPTIQGPAWSDATDTAHNWVQRDDRIGYLKLTEISASTLHELRQFAQRLESVDTRGLILDLRGLRHAGFHAAVLLADSLLDRGTIGRLRTAERVMTYQADADCLFRDWPLVALIDQGTSGPAEWLAAALQDNGRAKLVGRPTAGVSQVQTYVPIGDGSFSVRLTTGMLERADGRALTQNEVKVQPVDPASAPGPPVVRSTFGVRPDASASIKGRAAAVPERSPGSRGRPSAGSTQDPELDVALKIIHEALAKRRGWPFP